MSLCNTCYPRKDIYVAEINHFKVTNSSPGHRFPTCHNILTNCYNLKKKTQQNIQKNPQNFSHFPLIFDSKNKIDFVRTKTQNWEFLHTWKK